jgi:hypothetical protein
MALHHTKYRIYEIIFIKTSELVIDKDNLFFQIIKIIFFNRYKTGFINWKQNINSNLRPIIRKLIFTISQKVIYFY